MSDSILDTVKVGVGVEPTDTDFDDELITYINSVFLIFNQMGIGPKKVFSIKGRDEVWDDFYDGRTDIQAAQSDMILRVKMMFDSAGMSSGLVDSVKKEIEELEWRLIFQVEVNGGVTNGEV